MLSIFLFNILLLCSPITNEPVEPVPTVSIDDFKIFNGLYTGTLTYKDYTGGEIVTMNIVANSYISKNNFQQDILINEKGGVYQQNPKYQIKDGKIHAGKELQILEKEKNTETGMFKLVVSNKGKDGNQNRPCTFRYTMQGNSGAYFITKEVKFDDEGAYFIRNQYRFERLPEVEKSEFVKIK